jgi:large subunit ribosomal protein L33
MRDLVALQCEECKRKNYTTTRNKKRTTEKLAMKKFCSACRAHRPHKEVKV